MDVTVEYVEDSDVSTPLVLKKFAVTQDFEQNIAEKLKLTYKPKVQFYQHAISEYLNFTTVENLPSPIQIRILNANTKVQTNQDIVEIIKKWLDGNTLFTGEELLEFMMDSQDISSVTNVKVAAKLVNTLIDEKFISDVEGANRPFSNRATYRLEGYGTNVHYLHEDLNCNESLFVFGNGEYKPKLFDISKISISKIACGSTHFLALSTTCHIYSWGEGSGGQLGLGEMTEITSPTLIRSLQGQPITQIFAGGTQSVAIIEKDSGEVNFYHWGWRVDGVVNTPTECHSSLFKNKKITGVSMGQHHTCLLAESPDESTHLYTWGKNQKGQLGLGDFDDRIQPTIIERLKSEKLVCISSGNHHSLAVSEEGKVFTWGSNAHGVLGLGVVPKNMVNLPTAIQKLSHEKIKTASCGAFHSIVINEQGECYSWGYGLSGRLGLGNEMSFDIPQKIPRLSKITHLSCGYAHTLASSLSPTKEEFIYGWGDANGGRLGLQTDAFQSTPQKISIPGKIIIDLFTGAHKSAIFCVDDPLKFLSLAGVGEFGNNDVEKEKLLYTLKNTSSKVHILARKNTIDSLPKIKMGSSRNIFKTKSKTPNILLFNISKFRLDFAQQDDEPISTFTKVSDTLTLTNESKVPIYFSFSCTSSNVFKLDIFPRDGIVEKNSSINVEFTIVLFKTAKVDHLIYLYTEEREKGSEKEKDKEKEKNPSFKNVIFFTLESKSIFNVREVEFEKISSGEVIGSGAFGTVFKVDLDGETLAVKKFRINVKKNEFELFKREILVASNLKNDYIVNCKGLCLKYPNICMLMEYFPLGDLRNVLRTQTLPQTLLIKICFDIAMGMRYIHLSKILHRDLKQDNVMIVGLELNGKVNAKVTDFGTSCISDKTKEVLTYNIGTYRYLPPEAFDNINSHEKFDVYSYSILLWEIFSNEVAYSGLNEKDLINSVKKGEKLPLTSASFPPIISQLVSACWQTLPEERPTFDEIAVKLYDELKSKVPFETNPLESSSSSSSHSSHRPRKLKSNHNNNDDYILPFNNNNNNSLNNSSEETKESEVNVEEKQPSSSSSVPRKRRKTKTSNEIPKLSSDNINNSSNNNNNNNNNNLNNSNNNNNVSGTNEVPSAVVASSMEELIKSLEISKIKLSIYKEQKQKILLQLEQEQKNIDQEEKYQEQILQQILNFGKQK